MEESLYVFAAQDKDEKKLVLLWYMEIDACIDEAGVGMREDTMREPRYLVLEDTDRISHGRKNDVSYLHPRQDWGKR